MENICKVGGNNRLIVEESQKKNECENSAVYLSSKKIRRISTF